MATHLETLGDFLDQRHTVAAYCTAYFKCPKVHSGTRIDLEALAARYGRDYPVDEIKKAPAL